MQSSSFILFVVEIDFPLQQPVCNNNKYIE